MNRLQLVKGQFLAAPFVVVLCVTAGTAVGKEARKAADLKPAQWSKAISPRVIEEEIKAINTALEADVATPEKFRGGGYKDCRRRFSILAMLFAVNAEHDGDVPWRMHAPMAR